MRNPHLDPDKDQLPPEEQQYERALRPKALQDFSGQPKIVENLKIFIQEIPKLIFAKMPLFNMEIKQV